MRTRGSELFIVLPLLPIFLIGVFPMLLLSLMGPAGLIILGILVASAVPIFVFFFFFFSCSMTHLGRHAAKCGFAHTPAQPAPINRHGSRVRHAGGDAPFRFLFEGISVLHSLFP